MIEKYCLKAEKEYKKKMIKDLQLLVKTFSEQLPKDQYDNLMNRIISGKIEDIRDIKKLKNIGSLIERSLKKIDPLLYKAAEAIVREKLNERK